MILTRKQMDTFKCSEPDCKDPSHELIMHSKCHIDFPTYALISDGILELQCAKCGKLIFHIAIAYAYGDNVNIVKVDCQDKECKQKHHFIFPKCHEAPIWAVYYKKTGLLEIRCAECERFVYSIAVKEE